jgi:hypothetical protein
MSYSDDFVSISLIECIAFIRFWYLRYRSSFGLAERNQDFTSSRTLKLPPECLSRYFYSPRTEHMPQHLLVRSDKIISFIGRYVATQLFLICGLCHSIYYIYLLLIVSSNVARRITTILRQYIPLLLHHCLILLSVVGTTCFLIPLSSINSHLYILSFYSQSCQHSHDPSIFSYQYLA